MIKANPALLYDLIKNYCETMNRIGRYAKYAEFGPPRPRDGLPFINEHTLKDQKRPSPAEVFFINEHTQKDEERPSPAA